MHEFLTSLKVSKNQPLYNKSESKTPVSSPVKFVLFVTMQISAIGGSLRSMTVLCLWRQMRTWNTSGNKLRTATPRHESVTKWDCNATELQLVNPFTPKSAKLKT